MVDTFYYEDNLEDFLADYYYDNADMQSEINSEKLEQYVCEIFYMWKALVEVGEDDWVAARIAYDNYI